MDTAKDFDLALRPGFLTEKDGSRRLTGYDLIDRNTGGTVGTVYADKEVDVLPLASVLSAAEELRSAAEEALRQIEYLHGKFQGTGSGEAVVQRLRSALGKAENPTLSFEGEDEELTLQELKEILEMPAPVRMA